MDRQPVSRDRLQGTVCRPLKFLAQAMVRFGKSACKTKLNICFIIADCTHVEHGMTNLPKQGSFVATRFQPVLTRLDRQVVLPSTALCTQTARS